MTEPTSLNLSRASNNLTPGAPGLDSETWDRSGDHSNLEPEPGTQIGKLSLCGVAVPKTGSSIATSGSRSSTWSPLSTASARSLAAALTIGVLCSPALGDTLLFSAVLRDLTPVFFPAARILHFCTKQNLAAAEILSGADERVVLDLTKPGPTLRALRSQKLDLMIDFSSWLRLTALYAHLSGAKFVAGFRTPGQYRSRGYTIWPCCTGGTSMR